AADPDAARPVLAVDLQRAVLAERLVVLADLVALREVRVEVVLPRPDADRVDPALQRAAHPDRVLHHLLVQHRERAGHAQAHEAGVRVGRGAELGRAAAEDLAPGQELGVDLEPDDLLEIGHAHAAPRGGVRRWKSCSRSNARAMRSTRASSQGLPRICRPMGRLALVNPQGGLSPGSPARLQGKVKTSLRYIASGSLTFSPMRKAAVGEVGEITASTVRNASAKSCLMSVRTFCAFR